MPQDDVRDYYCIADDGRLYSTARDEVVGASDTAYRDWVASGGIASKWPRDAAGQQSRAALEEALVLAGLRAPPAPMPDLTPRQFGTGLWSDGIISFAEADLYVAVRTIPAALQTLVDALPDDESGAPTPRKRAILLLRGAATFDFTNPLVETIRAAWGWSSEELRTHWSAWAAL